MDGHTRKLLKRPTFVEGLNALAQDLELPVRQARRRARSALQEMWTKHGALETAVWTQAGNVFLRNYDVAVSERTPGQLEALDAEHPLIILFSHRSYLDAFLVREGLRRAGLSPMLTIAGANLDFFPLGGLIRRTGGLFVRRSTKDDPVYRYVLRHYLAFLLRARQNVGWSIEGGRSRTGKLRPPRYGVLRYMVDAVREAAEGPETYVLPVSCVYDQLNEVPLMAAEALGANKSPEGVGWMLSYVRMLLDQSGGARIDFGEPLPLGAHLAELDADAEKRGNEVERIALTVCHHINRVTPAMPTAVVTLALLAAARGLTVDEVGEELSPIVKYLAEHPSLPSTLRGRLDELDWVQPTLERLVERGVVARYDEGIEPVYHIDADQHLVAAFYRNTLIHFLVVRAIGELAYFIERNREGDLREAIWNRALELRGLLKFEFFFSSRRAFMRELLGELELVDPEWQSTEIVTRDRAHDWLELTRPFLGHLVLRPFLDAYRVLADELERWPVDEPVDDEALLERCLQVGRQRVIQKHLHSPESVTLELFKNALQLADHRDLVRRTGAEVHDERAAFAEQLGFLVEQLVELAHLQRHPRI